jgi:hypothetical protein
MILAKQARNWCINVISISLNNYPNIEPRLYELLDLHRSKYLQLLQEENANEAELASCHLAIQYYLGRIVSVKKAQRPQNSFAQFFKSILIRVMPSRMSQPSVS